MATYGYPVPTELRAIGADFVGAMTLDDPIFQFFPIEEVNDHYLAWEQEDNYTGMQQIRGLNGEPPRVAPIGGKRYLMEPGVYGEHSSVDETELTRRREWGRYDGTIPISDLVRGRQNHLVSRDVARKRFILWKLLTTGAFSVSNIHGAVLHAGSYTMQTFTATVPWSTVATATPLKDLRAVARMGRGRGVSFGRQARAFANLTTIHNMLNNTNPADLGGKRVGGGNTAITLEDMNKIFAADDLLPIEVMEDGYIDDAGTFQLYVPDGVVSAVGHRPGGERIGEYRMTRNANNPDGAPGDYDFVYEEPEPPKEIRVHRGHNGGPVLFRPGSIVRMSV